MSGTVASPEGITNPPIDELLEAADSKYGLVIFAAKRARQINAYYCQLGEGLLEYVGPLVETHVAGEAAVDRAARDQRGPARRRAPPRGDPASGPAARPGHDRLAVRRRVVLGVAGGIAAYKACLLLRLLTEAGTTSRVVPTARRPGVRRRAHLGRAVGQPGHHRRLGRRPEVPHVRLGREADLVVVAPATADLLARAAHGLADDLLTTTLLTARCPVLLAPAMHTEMWQHPATQDNVATLRSRGRRRARAGRPGG